jgi:hypothetical protein
MLLALSFAQPGIGSVLLPSQFARPLQRLFRDLAPTAISRETFGKSLRQLTVNTDVLNTALL